MRIALLSTGHPKADAYPDGGGIQYEIQGLAESLVSLGHDVHVLARTVNLEGPTSKGVNYLPVAPNGRDEVLSVIDFGRRAAGHIKEIDPDILYLSERFSAAYASRLKLTKVFALHNFDGLRPYWRFAVGYNPANLFLFPFKRQLEEGVMRRCQRVIVPARSWLGYLVQNRISGGVTISHGLRTEDYMNRGDDAFLLYAGRLNRVKGVDILLRAFAGLTYDNGHNLLLAGAGPDELEFRSLAKKLGMANRVIFLGHIPKARLLYLMSTCTALVLPSRWETFGITAAEGLASGKPVVASNIPGPKDFIEDGGNGLLFPPGDVPTLRGLLTGLLNDKGLRQRLGQEARKRAIETLAFERIALEHQILYSALLENRRLGA